MRSLQCLKLYAPAASKGEEEAFRNYFCKAIRDWFLAILLDFHSGGECADFEDIRPSDFVCGFCGQGLDHHLLESA